MGQFATSDGAEKRGPIGRYLTFEVAPELVDQNLDWSPPVRFKFEKHEDGTVTMLLQTVERS
jgi:hypothetical protein